MCRLEVHLPSKQETLSSNSNTTKEKKIVGVNLIKVHYKHVWKYHNETPLYN
jgi:hypothetical protein